LKNEDIRVLVVDDNEDVCELARKLLSEKGFAVDVAYDGAEALKSITAEASFDLVLMDVDMPHMDGIEALKRITKFNPAIPVIMMSGLGQVGPAVEAMRLGARDYLTHKFDPDELEVKIERALEETRIRREVRNLRTILGHSSDLRELMGSSAPMMHLYGQLETVSGTDFTVIIYGESGSGKELVARAIHQNSQRAERLFVPVDCGSIPENLIESELFGHERGSFTGAYERKKGSFERASGGTLFLDEIANLPKTMQAKLLRSLQERRIERIGGTGPIEVDIRVIAAANRRLPEVISEGKFREDLFHRLNEFMIEIPPLRKRKDDLAFLTRRFMDATADELKKGRCEISDPAFQMLLDYDWPGNVRELRNVIRRAVLLADNVIRPQHLTALASAGYVSAFPVTRIDTSAKVPLKEMVRSVAKDYEQKLIAHALEQTGGNKSRAAKLLDIDYKTILTKINEYNLAPQQRTR